MTLLLGYKKQLVEDKYDLDQLMLIAQQKVDETTAGSLLLKSNNTIRIPSLMHTEVHIGRFLGKGGFGVVCEVAKVELDDGAESTATTVAIELSNSSRTYPGYELFMKDYKANGFAGTAAQKQLPPPPPPILADYRGFGSTTTAFGNHKKANKSSNQKKRETVQDRDFIAANYKRRTTTTSTTTGRLGRLLVLGRTQKVKARYAIKRIKDNCLDSGEQFVNGVIDLAIEARFLSVLRHPNIIKMRATAMTDPFSPEDPYFIVLDKLDDILGKRLVQWAAREQSVVRKLHCQSHRVEQDFWMERIKVAHDVANALKYLHGRHVLYRDIKPENIGFDVRGDVKIFDFGLAKELNPIFSDRDGTYQLTAMTGSLRYMAPEVFLGQRYNETADVYSLSVLLWQLLSLRTPYEHYVRESIFRERMAHMGKRPPIDEAWPADLRDLLRRGWSANLADRPTMGHVSLALKYELDRYSLEETIDFVKPFDLHLDTDELDDDDVSRKSELSYARMTAEPVPSLLSTMTVESPPKDRNAVAAANPRRLRRS